MKKVILSILFLILAIPFAIGQGGVSLQSVHAGYSVPKVDANEPDWVNGKKDDPQPQDKKYKIKWTADPFDHQLFVENKGQFDTDTYSKDKIFFYASIGDVKMYFTNNGVIYKYIEAKKNVEKEGKNEDEEEREKEERTKPTVHYFAYQWENSSPDVTLEAKDELSYPYVYQTGPSSSMKVNIFRKIVYHNIYPGIDIEYSFEKGKQGIKYSVIVHPGAEASVVKLKYLSGNLHADGAGDAIIASPVGEITDHAPVTYLQNSHSKIASTYKLNGSEESFSLGSKNLNTSSENIVIDPWTTNPLFTAPYDKAYDVDYDQQGNVYAYGGSSPYQLTKFNSAGVQQWTVSATGLATYTYYGDFAVDKVTGTSYLTEGFNSAGAHALKINTNGTLLATFPGNAGMLEMWRVVYNQCTRQIVIGGGGTNSPNTQACILDTNMVTMTPVNPLGSTVCCRDVCLEALDPVTNVAYMAVAQSTGPDDLMSLPVPALIPANYIVGDAYAFQEVFSVSYVSTGAGEANGFNGMAASPNWLYMYDGSTLTKVNKASGAAVSTVTTGGTMYGTGGLDADGCDNVYAGVQSSIKVYNSALSLLSTIALSNTVYDVVLGPNYTTIYAGGVGFVSAVTVVSAPSVTITNAVTPTSCSGCTGTATPTILICGAAPVTTPNYLWTPSGQTTQTATNLCKGTYTCTISMGCGQLFTDTVTIPAGGAGTLTLTKTTNDIKCFGGTGSASVVASGGTAPYTYTWAGGSTSTSAAATNLTAGTYTVTVADASCASDTAIFHITAPPQLRDSITASTNASCGANNGTATVGVKGGTPGYTYSWAPSGGNAATGINLSSGTYTVTVTDASGCTNTATVTITSAPGVRDSITATVNESCFGDKTGSATVGVKGGTLPYTYSWNTVPVQTTPTATGLGAGSYTVVVKDANGCKDSAVVTITQPTQIRDSIAATTMVSCFGGNNGSATVGVKNGTPGYTYSWNTLPVQTTPTASTLTAGTYVVTVKDNNGCTSTATVVITQPALLTVTAAAFNVSCPGGCNGTAAVIPNGGTTPYSYIWNTVPVTTVIGTGGSISNLCPGTYSVQVTDANGCVHDSTPLTVTAPPAFSITKTTTAANCGKPDGSGGVAVTGGTPGYTYLWSTLATTPTIANVTPGSYCVTITDANKCQDTACIIVANIPGETASITATTNVTCNGGNDGTATGGAVNGTGPYTYSWNTAPVQNTQTATGLAAGSYTVTVHDANGCIDSAVAVITQPALVVSTLSAPVTICIGQSTTLTANSVGGTAPYTYTWTPAATLSASTGTPVTASPVITTTYTLTTSDVNGCPAVPVMVTVTVNPPLSVTTVSPDSICPTANATLSATGKGGDGTYTYTWAPAAGLSCTNCQNPSASPAATTMYTVVVSDACGTPVAVDSVRVVVNPLPSVLFKADTLQGCSPLCVNFTDLTTIASGGLFSWVWTFGDGGTSNMQNPNYCYQNAGIYSVGLSVMSKEGCSSSINIPNLITVYSHPVAAFVMSPDPVTIVSPTVQFTDKSTDNYGIASWNWVFNDQTDESSTLENPSHTYIDTGTYCANLVVTNIHGCTDTNIQCIDIQPFYTLYIPNAFTPNNDGLNDVFMAKGEYVCSFQMFIFDRWGMQLYYSEDINKGWDGTVNGGSNLVQEDTYIYLINAIDCVQHKKHQYLGKVTLIK